MHPTDHTELQCSSLADLRATCERGSTAENGGEPFESKFATWAYQMAPAVSNPPRRILFLDAYDSFSNNIVALIEQNTNAKVTKLFIDDARFLSGNSVVDPKFVKYAQEFDAVVAGPGPGWAGCDKDVGLNW